MDPREITESLDLYLPMGRVAGATAIVAFASNWPSQRLVTLEARIDDGLGTTDFQFSGVDRSAVSFRGRLVGPAGPLVVDVSRNLNAMTDVPDEVMARVTLCPVAPLDAPQLVAVQAFAPVGDVRLVPGSPVASGTEGLRLRVGGVEVPSSARVDDGAVIVTPARGLAPGAPVALDVGTLRDVMGRPYTLAAPPITMTTTATVTDRTFATLPPAGAVASTVGVAVRNGRLTTGGSSAGPYRMLVALGEFPGARQVSVRYGFNFGGGEGFSAWLVAADGHTTALPLSASPGASATVTGEIPGDGPLWLLIESGQRLSQPGTIPFSLFEMELDEVSGGS